KRLLHGGGDHMRVGDAEFGDVATQELHGLRVGFDEQGVLGAPGERLEPHRAGPGVQVGEAEPFQVPAGSERVEQRFADPVGGGPGAVPRGRGETAALEGAGDDSGHEVPHSNAGPPAQPFSRYSPRSSARASTSAAKAGSARNRGSAASSATASALAVSMMSASRSSDRSLTWDFVPDCAAPRTSPSRRCSKSSSASAKPSVVEATASSRSREPVPSIASLT